MSDPNFNMQNIKLNIVCFHIGHPYDETLDSYYDFPSSLYRKCFESLKKEFKDDNILVFHSFEEVFQKYPMLQEEYYTYNFLKINHVQNEGPYFKSDLVRSLLTKYLENMVYVDSDIEILPGTRDTILKKYNENGIMYIPYDSICFFLSKHKSESYLRFISDAFNDHDYASDLGAIKAHLKYDDEIKRWNDLKIRHYYSLRRISAEVNNFLIIKECCNHSVQFIRKNIINNNKNIAIIYTNKDNLKILCTCYEDYYFGGLVNIQDIIDYITYYHYIDLSIDYYTHFNDVIKKLKIKGD